MLPTRSFAAKKAKSPLEPYNFERREPGAHDVLIDIRFCGVCHSDIHQARDEWGGATFPMVPGHEIAGVVSRVGSAVTKYKVGDAVGVGCFVDSCRECAECRSGDEQFCQKGAAFTYNSKEKDGTPTQGGYSTQIVVNEDYVVRIPTNLALDIAAPLLCAGITTYSPLKQWGVGKGHKLAVVGLGGLGHMGVKIGAALGAEVTVFSHSDRKKADAERLGARAFVSTAHEGALEAQAGKFDFVLDTVSAPHDYNAYLALLKTGGTMIVVGVPDQPMPISAFSLISGRRKLAGSLIGGIRETQEMLDFCAKHKIGADIEVIPIQKINEAYERTIKGDVRYRFVIDIESLKK